MKDLRTLGLTFVSVCHFAEAFDIRRSVGVGSAGRFGKKRKAHAKVKPERRERSDPRLLDVDLWH